MAFVVWWNPAPGSGRQRSARAVSRTGLSRDEGFWYRILAERLAQDRQFRRLVVEDAGGGLGEIAVANSETAPRFEEIQEDAGDYLRLPFLRQVAALRDRVGDELLAISPQTFGMSNILPTA
jgi:hypothetical protein